MRVLAVASEAYPAVKTGGLADVVGALPGALAPLGVEVRTLIPGYRAVMAAAPGAVLHEMELMGGPARIRAGAVAGLALLVLEAPHLFDRAGGPYNAPDGSDWGDNPQRFAALCQAGVAVARGALAGWRPDVVHAHDWQAGFVPAYLAFDGGPRVPSVFTVHNLAFQGFCPASMLPVLGLPPASFTVEGVEFYGGISPLKAGLQLADRITTVSPTYAAEITRPEDGQGLDGLLRARAGVLSGIANGIDTGVWDPARDRLLPARYSGVAGRRRGEEQGGAVGRVRAGRGARCAAVRDREPVERAEGDRPGAGGGAGAGGDGGAAGRARDRRGGAGVGAAGGGGGASGAGGGAGWL